MRSALTLLWRILAIGFLLGWAILSLLVLEGCGQPSVDLECLDVCYQDERLLVSSGAEFAGWRMEDCIRRQCNAEEESR